MTSNDLLSLGMPAIAAVAVLMTGGVVAYWATHHRRLKSKPRKVILADSDVTAKASVALRHIREAVEDAERLLRHATEKT